MLGKELHDILWKKGVRTLHHANSVMTSISIIQLGGLASRHLVERSGLNQSGQYTDDLDREFGIWDDVFMDTVDIHKRISNRNQYGPVLFELDIAVLNALPRSAQVLVSKLNPSKWGASTPSKERYFEDALEASTGLRVGNFDQMLMIGNVNGIIPFEGYLKRIILDDVVVGNEVSPEFQCAEREINLALQKGGIGVQVTRRGCVACRCYQTYSAMSASRRNMYWAP
ncbi:MULTISPECIES: hypothetical protein [unclassified Paraburkholderia]|uniref:hypothetical protein n=1 Tax=unclassified Paraburkholderia TaxID=2615204 RepID=UPI002AB0CF35|nr:MULTISPECIES: hypothetical protein [unclassified Paraburkholderia]